MNIFIQPDQVMQMNSKKEMDNAATQNATEVDTVLQIKGKSSK